MYGEGRPIHFQFDGQQSLMLGRLADLDVIKGGAVTAGGWFKLSVVAPAKTPLISTAQEIDADGSEPDERLWFGLDEPMGWPTG